MRVRESQGDCSQPHQHLSRLSSSLVSVGDRVVAVALLCVATRSNHSELELLHHRQSAHGARVCSLHSVLISQCLLLRLAEEEGGGRED